MHRKPKRTQKFLISPASKLRTHYCNSFVKFRCPNTASDLCRFQSTALEYKYCHHWLSSQNPYQNPHKATAVDNINGY